MAIIGFRNSFTKDVSKGTFASSNPIPTSVQMQARAQLSVLDKTKSIDELKKKFPVERLGGPRKGEFMLPVAKDYGVCFFWDDNNKSAEEVELVNTKTSKLELLPWK